MNIQMITPIYVDYGPSRPWTNTDTKVGIAITIAIILIWFLSSIAYLIRDREYDLKDNIRNIFTCDVDAGFLCLISYVLMVCCGIVWMIVGIYNLL